jgi:hypothetical protein
LDKDATNANLIAARKAADDALKEATTKFKTATEARLALDKSAQAAAERLKAATEAKAAADKSLAEIDARSKKNAAFLQNFNQEFIKLQEKSKPVDLAVSGATSAITLNISPAPVTLEPIANNLTLQQAGQLKLAVPIKRLYEYAGPVQLIVRLPAGVAGISSTVPNATIAPDQSQGTLVIDAAAAVTPGTYMFTVTAYVTMQGQSASVEREFPVTITKAASAN